jgi:hypothetical protein
MSQNYFVSTQFSNMSIIDYLHYFDQFGSTRAIDILHLVCDVNGSAHKVHSINSAYKDEMPHGRKQFFFRQLDERHIAV